MLAIPILDFQVVGVNARANKKQKTKLDKISRNPMMLVKLSFFFLPVF
jgi:hypothetical protein